MSKEIVSESIDKILGLDLPCENGEVEVLCDECPFDVLPKVDCGLAILKERARMITREMITERGNDYIENICSECGFKVKLLTPEGLQRRKMLEESKEALCSICSGYDIGWKRIKEID